MILSYEYFTKILIKDNYNFYLLNRLINLLYVSFHSIPIKICMHIPSTLKRHLLYNHYTTEKIRRGE